MNKTVQRLVVERKEIVNSDNFILSLKSPIPLVDVQAGQFLSINVEKSKDVFLRRPFSIHDVHYDNNTLDVLIKTVGPGSAALKDVEVGDEIDTIFPLGNSFSKPKKGEKVLLIGGGVGIAPMLYLAKILGPITSNINILLGSRKGEDQILLDRYSEVGNVLTTTEDGTVGEKGYVTDHSFMKNELENVDRIYCCGPEPMMKSIAKLAKEKQVACEVSLENMMGCGFGVCLCCVTDTQEGHKCVCSDGPIFNIEDLKW
ncbi:dihydroorotate dehydrogenase electron transfer subunit [Halosquirtibacter xylanolyticus]|uniref:dihydroorotate dehydrogenase electron transfer subunit n=1 Tax=Halosquirtibacter xylanolyticus TaxID=3374599 RepID=UPI00374821A0|nr:dihydroorotate dehydrogenase electron transfer subunit [Prolixibacteraceae bacterium]